MSVTFVYDGADATRYWFNELHRQLQLVQPRIQLSLQSCGDLEDDNLDKTHPFLLVLSKKTHRLHITFVNALINKVGSARNVFIVVETEDAGNACFENLSEKSNFACVEDLFHSFKWLPKVCVFLFKRKPHRSLRKQCIVPRIKHDVVSLALREDLLASLLELDIKVSETLDDWSPDNICVILRNDNRESLETSILEKQKRHGMICFEYILHFEDKRLTVFSKSTQLLFLFHLLYHAGLVNIKRIHNICLQQTDTKIDMSNIVRLDSPWSFEPSCKMCDRDFWTFILVFGILLIVYGGPLIYAFYAFVSAIVSFKA